MLRGIPKAKATMHITSSSTPPSTSEGVAINPAYLSHPLDLELLARHMYFMDRKLSQTAPLGGLLEDRGAGKFADLEEARQYVRRTRTRAHHFTSMCAMAPRAVGGVVDERLRVCDASVVPLTLRANT
ncbi:hypothetical protein B0T17DRAFT_528359 [Bombardia bombarda]|uniref:Glucose-methanol-choline oxidoreductase C-terminal domain-containing protein n=1 Tax=Bombardia bombarda TaxID=252184 RepID=A0AA39XBJ4_9PEZI|nr:hypothetical protein B0T17DRAFT_528359 [Bombardia bombarda]